MPADWTNEGFEIPEPCDCGCHVFYTNMPGSFWPCCPCNGRLRWRLARIIDWIQVKRGK